jgi:hypothetical protein
VVVGRIAAGKRTMMMGCAMCFRKLTAQRWTTGKPDAIGALVRADGAPYAQIVLQRLEQMALCGASPVEALLCDYCACFIKERTVRYLPCDGGGGVQVRRGRKHGMHMAVEHVLSGGSLPSPSRPHFLRCLAILEQPEHPFLAVEHGALGERLCGRKRVCGQEDCVVRWLFEGRPHVFVDPVLAKNMRRWISMQQQQQQQPPTTPITTPLSSPLYQQQQHHPPRHHYYYYYHSHQRSPVQVVDGGEEGGGHTTTRRRRRRSPSPPPPLPTAEVTTTTAATTTAAAAGATLQRAWDAPLPEACRLCVRAGTTAAAGAAAAASYAGALAFGAAAGAMEAALLEIERESADTVLEPDLCVYCLQCHRVATISFEYSRALRSLLGLEEGEASADAYYAHRVALFHGRRTIINLGKKEETGIDVPLGAPPTRLLPPACG